MFLIIGYSTVFRLIIINNFPLTFRPTFIEHQMTTKRKEEEMQTAPFARPRSDSPHNLNVPTFSGGHRTVQLTLTNHSPVPEKSASGFSEGEAGSTAREYLKNVKDEDDQDLDQRKRSWLSGRKSPTPFQNVPEGGKYYARMGILVANSPDVRTHPLLERGREMPRNMSLPPTTRWSAQATPQCQQLSVPSRSGTRPTSYFDGLVEANRRLEAQRCGEQITRPKSDSFDLLDDVDSPKSGIGNGSPQNELSVLPVRGTSAQQPSPPINLKNETKEEPTCTGSPDSGYGNTPENNTGASNTSEAEGSSLRPPQKMLRTGKTHLEIVEPQTVPDTLQVSPQSKCENLSSVERFGSSQPGTREPGPRFNSSCVGEEFPRTNLSQNVKAERDDSETKTDIGYTPSLPPDQQMLDATEGVKESRDGSPFPHLKANQEHLIRAGPGVSSPYLSIHNNFRSTPTTSQPAMPMPMRIQYGHPSPESASNSSPPSSTRKLSMSTRLAAEVPDSDFSNLDIAPFRRRALQMDQPTRLMTPHRGGRGQGGGNGSPLKQHSATMQAGTYHHPHDRVDAIISQQRRRARSHSQPMGKSLGESMRKPGPLTLSPNLVPLTCSDFSILDL